MGDVRELMLRNTKLLCKDGPVTLCLRQQNHKVCVIKDVFNFTARQQVLHILRQCRGNTTLFTKHLPYSHKVACCQMVTEQDMELIKITPCSQFLRMVGIYRRGHKFVCDVHGNFAEIFTHVFQNDADYTGVRLDIGVVIEQVEGAGAVKLQRRCHPLCLRLRLFQQFLVQIL